MPADYFDQTLTARAGVVVLDSGKVYITTNDIYGRREAALWKLDPGTGTISKLADVTSGGAIDKYDRLVLSPDASLVYGEVEGIAFTVNTAADTFHQAASVSAPGTGQHDLAISGDGSTVDINGYFADASLAPENVPAYVDWETWLPETVAGQKLNHDGSLLFSH